MADINNSQEFIDALQLLFGENANLTKQYVEGVVDEDISALRTEIFDQINIKAGDLTALQNAMNTFYTAVDAADLEGEDGEIKIAESFTSIFSKIGINEANITTVTTLANNLQTALNTEVTNRTQQGTDLTTAIDTVKNNLLTGIGTINTDLATLTARVTTVEDVAGRNRTWITGVVDAMPQLKTDMIADVRVKLGLP